MKKILHIILILCLVFLAGCGGPANQETDNNQLIAGGATGETEEAGVSEEASEPGTPAGSEQTGDTGVIASASTGAGVSGTVPAGQGGAAKVDPPASGQGTSSGGSMTSPGEKPAPVEPQDASVDKKTELHCTLTITCKTILDNLDKFDQAKLELVPEDGVIYQAEKVVFYEGESVFDVLLRETKQNKIHMEFVGTPGYNSNYIEGINNIYEFDCGELSGWMYKVSDWFPNYGSSRYALKDGDRIEWIYTCDLGRDIGGDWNAQNQTEEQ